MPLLLLATAFAAFPAHDEPLRTGNVARGDAAVVVGIEDYFALPDVPFARRDAHAFADLLIYTVGVPAGQVHTLTTDASKERIRMAVDEAVDQVAADGTLWLYFAGHGAASTEDGERILLGIDTMADAASFEARSVRLDDLQESSKGVPRTIIVVDACYAGAGRAGEELLAGKRFAVPSYATSPRGTWVEWNAAQPNQLSGPLAAARHGAFTWAAIGALRGWADGQLDGITDGTVTFDEADLYVREALRSLDINDQVPALVIGNRDDAAVSLPRSEKRPGVAELRVAARVAPPKAESTSPPPPTGPTVVVPTVRFKGGGDGRAHEQRVMQLIEHDNFDLAQCFSTHGEEAEVDFRFLPDGTVEGVSVKGLEDECVSTILTDWRVAPMTWAAPMEAKLQARVVGGVVAPPHSRTLRTTEETPTNVEKKGPAYRVTFDIRAKDEENGREAVKAFRSVVKGSELTRCFKTEGEQAEATFTLRPDGSVGKNLAITGAGSDCIAERLSTWRTARIAWATKLQVTMHSHGR